MSEDATTAAMIAHLCQYCGIRTTYWCSRCHNVWYCSVEHMQIDWPNHRTYCHPYDEQNAKQQPSPHSPYSPIGPGASQGPATSVDNGIAKSPSNGMPFPPGAINVNQTGRGPVSPTSPAGAPTTTTEFDSVLFPCNEERPRIVRVPCMAQPQSSGPTIWTPFPQEQLGGIQEITSMIITHGIGGAPLRFPLHLFYGTSSFSDGSPLNRTIQRMTGGKAIYPWAGNIVALKFSGSRRQGYTDATYNDVAPLIASFLAKPGETS